MTVIFSTLAKKLNKETDEEEIDFMKSNHCSLLVNFRNEFYKLLPIAISEDECNEEKITEFFPEFIYLLELKRINIGNYSKLKTLKLHKIKKS